MIKEIELRTKERVEFIEITQKIQELIRKSEIDEGIVTIFVPHTTAGITINENADSDVVEDIKTYLNKLIPFSNNYNHTEGNSDAHIKASIIGSSVNVLISNKELLLGTWQGIFFCEFDGPRRRKIFVHIK